MATSRRTGVNEQISTYGAGGFGRDYTSLQTWEAATDNDLVTATESEVLECYDDAAEFDDTVNIGGADTNASYHRIIRPAGTIGTGGWQGHDGTPNNGVHFHNQSTSGLPLNEEYASLQDLIYQHTNPDENNTIGLSCGDPNCLLVGLIVIDITSANGTARGVRLENGVAVNCIVMRTDSFGLEFNDGNCYFYNCNSIDNGGRGFSDGGGTGICKNCLSDGNSNDDFEDGGNFASSNNNASSDDTAPGTSSRINQTFTFVASGSDNYHLTSGDAGARTYGADLSADGVFAFDDDIDGDTRS